MREGRESKMERERMREGEERRRKLGYLIRVVQDGSSRTLLARRESNRGTWLSRNVYRPSQYCALKSSCNASCETERRERKKIEKKNREGKMEGAREKHGESGLREKGAVSLPPCIDATLSLS